MGTLMIRKFARTNIFIIDQDLWNWAQYKAKSIGHDSVSEYIFDLIKVDKETDLIKRG
jgi:hypothetical protein